MGKNDKNQDWHVEIQAVSKTSKTPALQSLREPNACSFRRELGHFMGESAPQQTTGEERAGVSQKAKKDAGSSSHPPDGAANLQGSRDASRSPRRKGKEAGESDNTLAAPTQLDSPASPDARNPATKKQKTSSLKSFYPPSDPDDAVSKGFYRCFSYFTCKVQNELNEESAKKEASWIRVKVADYIEKHDTRWKALFDNDQSAFNSWVSSIPKTSTWVEGKALQAAAERFGKAVVVWTCKQNIWYRLVVAPKFSKGLACAASGSDPVLLVLKDKHYRVLKPPSNGRCPSTWLRETPGVVVDLTGAGKAKSSAGSKTPSVRTLPLILHRYVQFRHLSIRGIKVSLPLIFLRYAQSRIVRPKSLGAREAQVPCVNLRRLQFTLLDLQI